MPRPVIAYHVVLCNYGFWLPNAPRGSWSRFVRAPNIRQHGLATKVETRVSVAARRHDVRRGEQAQRDLVRPPVGFTGLQALSVANGFASRTTRGGYQVFACAIQPNHTHLVIGRHSYSIEQVVRAMRQQATTQLIADSRHPFAQSRLPSGRLPSVWCQSFWRVFLYTAEDVNRSIGYVEDNPRRAGLQEQRWSFCVPFSGVGEDASAMRR